MVKDSVGLLRLLPDSVDQPVFCGSKTFFGNFMNCGDRFYANNTISNIIDKIQNNSLVIYGNTEMVYDNANSKILLASHNHKFHHKFVHQSSFIDTSIIKKYKFDEIFCDLNIRPPFYGEETINLAIKSATILKISDEELPVIAKLLGVNYETDFAKQLCEKYCNLKKL